MAEAQIGVIGGSGLYQLEGLTDVEEVSVSTPFGDPSDSIVVGKLTGRSVAFLPRHGRGHRISPSNLPVQANIYALKSLGVERIISVSAVGSMKEQIEPLHIVIPDQIFDRTVLRPRTFFEKDIVVHASFAEPFCRSLRSLLVKAATDSGAYVHDQGTYLCMEGPQFSSKAESQIYRQWGVDVIGMTAIPEAKLAREAELCYATLALSTDYDCWRESEEAVTADMVVRNLNLNVAMAKKILETVIPLIPEQRSCACASALENAIITPLDKVPAEAKERYSLLIGKYVG